MEIGVYFRAKRNDKWGNVDIGELNEEEIRGIVNTRVSDGHDGFLASLIIKLLDTIRLMDQPCWK